MDKPVARFFNWLVVPLPIIPVLVILIRIQKSVYLYPRTRSRTHTLDSWHAGLVPVPMYPCQCTCTHGPRPRYTQDHIYSTNKVSKKTVILPHFFVCLFLVLDAGEIFWNLDKKIEYLWWNILIYKDKIDTVFSPFDLV